MKLQLKNNLKKYQRLILFYKIKNKGIFMINMVKKGYNKTNKGIKEEVMEVIDIMEDNKDLNGIMMYMILMKEIMSRNILINKILDNSKDLSISKKVLILVDLAVLMMISLILHLKELKNCLKKFLVEMN
mmetsp:Transcript_10070/g.899  ORF Transcript_10070/g.899 Transcript_10070/m.899 type:complete len:130 (+) Transcript_10070:173-562(+)